MNSNEEYLSWLRLLMRLREFGSSVLFCNLLIDELFVSLPI